MSGIDETRDEVAALRVANRQLCDQAREAKPYIEGLEAERDHYRTALAALLDDARDMRAYVPLYFAEKWGHDEALDRAARALEGLA